MPSHYNTGEDYLEHERKKKKKRKEKSLIEKLRDRKNATENAIKNM